MFDLKRVSLWAGEWGIEGIRIEPRRDGQGPFVVFECTEAERLRPLAENGSRTLRIVDPRQACVLIESEETDGEVLLGVVKEVLQPA